MKTESVEELFTELVNLPKDNREEHLSSSDCSDLVKQAAMRLVTVFETKSTFLNEDLLTDLANVAPEFFETDAEDELVLQPGDRLENYVVDSVAGEGGMSVVYLATQIEPVRRQVALKLIRPSVLAPKTVLRFFREQQALALLTHPNIATLYKVGTTSDGHPFAVIEFVDGLAITDYCKNNHLSYREKIELFVQACQGLSLAHHHGIIHRDIKPENILVGQFDGKATPKLIDFGIAKFLRKDFENNRTMTQLGQVLGSPRYMSPEQIEGREVDQRTDVYSAALVLFELLTHAPYRGGDTAETMLSHSSATEPELLSERLRRDRKKLKSAFPTGRVKPLLKIAKRELDWVLAKALARDPSQRYQSIEEFSKDLMATVNGSPIVGVVPSRTNRTLRLARNYRTGLAAVVAIGLLLISIVVTYNWRTSANELIAIKRANKVTVKRNAASNDLLMRLLASNQYQLTPEQFDLNLIPRYQGQYQQIKSSGGPKTREDKTVYGILAVLYAMSGDFDEADKLMEQVADVRQRTELRRVHEKICADYAKTVRKRLSEFDEDDRSQERAHQQLALGRCCIVLELFEEADQLIKDSISVFECNQSSSCDTLVARNTLGKVYEETGEQDQQLSLHLESYNRFRNNHVLLATRRGKIAFNNTIDALVKLNPQRFNKLKH